MKAVSEVDILAETADVRDVAFELAAGLGEHAVMAIFLEDLVSVIQTDKCESQVMVEANKRATR